MRGQNTRAPFVPNPPTPVPSPAPFVVACVLAISVIAALLYSEFEFEC